jgi:hypothetical protein
MFFNRPDFGLKSAIRGNFVLIPKSGMLEALRRGYDTMAGMIFGPVPHFDTVIHSIASFEGKPTGYSNRIALQ